MAPSQAEIPGNWETMRTLAREQGDVTVVLTTHRPALTDSDATVAMASGDAPTIASGDAATIQGSSRVVAVSTSPGEVRLRGEELDLLEKIGKGGMGTIFRATQKSLGREIAVKQINRIDDAHLKQFIAEARIAGLLEHANIAPVHLLGTSPSGAPLLAMKLLKGVSWSELLHGENTPGLTIEAHLRILISVCNALSFSHERGFIHRDIKPDNVMIGEFGQVFVVDWGLAATTDAARSRAEELPSVFESNATCGTPAYMAPELALGEGPAQGPHTDIYLLGACLHEIVTRERRHLRARSDSVVTVLQRAVESEAIEYPDDVPQELAKIANRATARVPEDRYATVEDFRRAIEDYLSHREARAIAAKGMDALESLQREIDAYELGPSRAEVSIHESHARATLALEHALSMWPQIEGAEEALHRADTLLFDHALRIEDVNLAVRLGFRLTDNARSRADELRKKVDARRSELESLRETTRRLDWAVIAAPLGNTFLVAGIVGAGACLTSHLLLNAASGDLYWPMTLLWSLVTLLVGGIGFRYLWLVRETGTLLSARVVGLWGSVAVACVAVGFMNRLHEQPLFFDSNYSALIIAVGFGAMAFQSRRWILVPAALFLVGALLMSAFPAVSLLIFGAVWLLGLSGVGVAIKLGATFSNEG